MGLFKWLRSKITSEKSEEEKLLVSIQLAIKFFEGVHRYEGLTRGAITSSFVKARRWLRVIRNRTLLLEDKILEDKIKVQSVSYRKNLPEKERLLLERCSLLIKDLNHYIDLFSKCRRIPQGEISKCITLLRKHLDEFKIIKK